MDSSYWLLATGYWSRLCRGSSILLLSGLLAGCSDPPQAPRCEQVYEPQSETPVTWLVIEWNGKPTVLASGALWNRDQGLVLTAKHFTDALFELRNDTVKVFVGGFMCNAEIAVVDPVYDAAFLRITDLFNPSSLPQPYQMAQSAPRIREKLRIQGFHPHPNYLSEKNAADKTPDTFVRILESYYQLKMRDPTKKTEVVFENLPARVEAVNVQVKIEGQTGTINELRFQTNRYIRVKTDKNHYIEIAGLSGGVALNEDGEVVALVTAERPLRFEFDLEGFLLDPKQWKLEIVADEIILTPIHNLSTLLNYSR